jgi:hypothetical protein
MKKRFALLAFLLTTPALAHQGPPFPILVDQKVGPYVASVWTDPDIGTGTFFVILEPPKGGKLPKGTKVRIAVQPVTGRLPEAIHPAELQSTQEGERYYAAVPFDQGGKWHARVLLDGPQGGGILNAEIEPTPDGTLGPVASLIYLVPFLGIGFLWFKAAMRRRETAQPQG